MATQRAARSGEPHGSNSGASGPGENLAIEHGDPRLYNNVNALPERVSIGFFAVRNAKE
jgi:hypothetical protein